MPTPRPPSGRRKRLMSDVERARRLASGAAPPAGRDPARRSRRRRAAARARPGRGGASLLRRLAAVTLHRLVRRPPLAERWPRPSVMGVVNVTPDSFSDGGDNLDPAVAVATARRLLRRGRGARRHRRRVDAPGRRPGLARRGAAPGAAGARAAGRRSGLDRHVEGGGGAPGARAGRDARQRRHGAARRSRSLPV